MCVCNFFPQVTVNLLIMGGNGDDVNQLVQAVRSRRRRVKVLKYPVDVSDMGNPSLHQTVLLEFLQNMSASVKQLLLLLPW